MRFFVLRCMTGSEAETLYEPVGERRLGDAPKCPVCGAWIGMKPWLPPYVVKLRAFGKRLGDIAFDVGDLLVSEKLLNAWNREGLRGLEQAHPAEVVRIIPKRMSAQCPRYFHLAVPRARTTRIDPLASTIIRDRPATCDLCGGTGIDAILGLRLDESSWSSEDIFVPWGVNRIIVTERVVALAAEYGLANATAQPIESFRWDPLWKFGGPTYG